MGFYGVVRRAEIYPRFPGLIEAEALATVGAVIAELSTLVWLLNLVLTLVRGRSVRLEGLSLAQIAGTVAMSMEWPSTLVPTIRFSKSHRSALTSLISIAIIGGILIFVSTFFLVFAGDTYTANTWIWISMLTFGIILAAIGSLKGMKSI